MKLFISGGISILSDFGQQLQFDGMIIWKIDSSTFNHGAQRILAWKQYLGYLNNVICFSVTFDEHKTDNLAKYNLAFKLE